MPMIAISERVPTAGQEYLPAVGTFSFVPTLAQNVSTLQVLPKSFTVQLDQYGNANVFLAPTTTTWAWQVTKTIVGQAAVTFTVAVKPTDSQFVNLVSVDPLTLAVVGPVPAWVALANGTVVSGSVNNLGHLILTRTDGTTNDAGTVVGPAGVAGPIGPQGVQGAGLSVLVPPPTGIANVDTNNLQTALNSVPTTGGTVWLQAGSYSLNAPLTVQNTCKIIGAGKGDLTKSAPTILAVSSPTADGIVVNAHGCTLESFAVVNTSSTTPTAGAGIHFAAGDGFAIDRIKMVGFWNNLQIDQARHYTVTDSHFIDQVNYGAYLRNIASGQGDFGDCTFHGCFFAAYNSTVIANSAIRWESGGGLKVIGCKTNGNMSTLGQSFTVGIDIKVVDGISTSVFVIDGNSLEGINSGGAPISVGQTGTGTGTITKIIVTNNETLAGGGIRFTGIQAGKIGQILVSGNTITGPTCGIYFQNVYGITVGSNRIQALPATDPAIWIATGCTDYTITAPDVDTTNVALIMDDSAQSNTHSRVGTTTTYTREIPSTTSNSTYTTLFSVQFNAFCSAVLSLNLTGQVAGVGSAVVAQIRAATQGAAATVPTLSTIGTDASTPTNAPQVLFDVTTNQTVLVKVRLGAAGTDVFGKASLTVDGLPSRVWKS